MRRFVDLQSACAKCDHDGTVRVWHYANEDERATARRHSVCSSRHWREG